MWIRRIIAALSIAALLVLAGGPAALAQSRGAQTFTLEPGGKATIDFTAFCLDFGVKFPTSIQAPNDTAQANVRAALDYIQSNNLTADQNKALEAQYAIWQLRGATGSPAGGDQAKAIVAAAKTPPAALQATSVVDAAKAGQVQVAVSSWQPVGQPVQLGSASDNFYGQGVVTVTNTSQQRLTLYMPVGTLFPPATQGDQTMAAFATNVQTQNPQPQAQAPQQLPNTADGGALPSWALVFGALALLAAGYFTRTVPSNE